MQHCLICLTKSTRQDYIGDGITIGDGLEKIPHSWPCYRIKKLNAAGTRLLLHLFPSPSLPLSKLLQKVTDLSTQSRGVLGRNPIFAVPIFASLKARNGDQHTRSTFRQSKAALTNCATLLDIAAGDRCAEAKRCLHRSRTLRNHWMHNALINVD